MQVDDTEKQANRLVVRFQIVQPTVKQREYYSGII